MRLIVWNIAYGTGCARSYTGQVGRLYNYVRTARVNIERICDFLAPYEPDVLGLLEIDAGSVRVSFRNQVTYLAKRLDMESFSHAKYVARSLSAHLPILGKQHNAVLYRKKIIAQRLHFLPNGMKKLVLETEFEDFSLFLVHLALSENVREKQSDALSLILPHEKPFILAGDFNAFAGTQEVLDLKRRFALHSLNTEHDPTFPAWRPRRELDFMLASHSIEGTLTIPYVQLSDHMPLIADITF